MNILQNNMSGRPIMIPVQEGLNVRLVPLKLLPKNILTPPFPLYFLQTFCNPLWYSFKPTRCDNSPPSYPKIGTKHKISTATSNIVKTTPTIFSRFLISFFLPGSSGFLELCTSKVIISGSANQLVSKAYHHPFPSGYLLPSSVGNRFAEQFFKHCANFRVAALIIQKYIFSPINSAVRVFANRNRPIGPFEPARVIRKTRSDFLQPFRVRVKATPDCVSPVEAVSTSIFRCAADKPPLLAICLQISCIGSEPILSSIVR